MDYVALALSLLQTVLASAHAGNAAVDTITTLEAAVAKILSVQGSDVSYKQLEDLRVTKAF